MNKESLANKIKDYERYDDIFIFLDRDADSTFKDDGSWHIIKEGLRFAGENKGDLNKVMKEFTPLWDLVKEIKREEEDFVEESERIKPGDQFVTTDKENAHGGEIITVLKVVKPESRDGEVFWKSKEKVGGKLNHCGKVWWFQDWCEKIRD